MREEAGLATYKPKQPKILRFSFIYCVSPNKNSLILAGRKLALSWHCKFIETSSGLDHNVDELLVGIFAQVQLNPKRSRVHQKNVAENGKHLFRQILKLRKKAKSCENLFVL